MKDMSVFLFYYRDGEKLQYLDIKSEWDSSDKDFELFCSVRLHIRWNTDWYF